MNWLKKFTKPLTPVVTLAAAIASTQLANVLFYSLALTGLAQFLVFVAQSLLAVTLISAVGYLVSSDD